MVLLAGSKGDNSVSANLSQAWRLVSAYTARDPQILPWPPVSMNTFSNYLWFELNLELLPRAQGVLGLLLAYLDLESAFWILVAIAEKLLPGYAHGSRLAAQVRIICPLCYASTISHMISDKAIFFQVDGILRGLSAAKRIYCELL